MGGIYFTPQLAQSGHLTYLKAFMQDHIPLTEFYFDEHKFTVVPSAQPDLGPWFVLNQVRDYLELDTRTSRLLKDTEDGDTKDVVVQTAGGTQRVLAVNEPTLYNLIFQSRKPQAKAFRRYVVREVLPAIRKTGQYQTKAKRLSLAKGQVVMLVHEICGKYLDFKHKSEFDLTLAALRDFENATNMPMDEVRSLIEDRMGQVAPTKRSSPAQVAKWLS